MVNSLIKLLDIALFPAALMTVAKFFGIWLVTTIYKLPWGVQQAATEIILRPAVNSSDLITISTYSDLVMFLIMSLGMLWVLIQATYFHDTHISPQMLVKLTNNDLFGLIKSSYEIYHRAAIWTLFAWLAGVTIWVNVFSGKTELWVGVIALVANVVYTIFLLQDVYREINLSRRNFSTAQAF